MSSNLVRAILIINAWSAESRAAAKLALERRKKVKGLKRSPDQKSSVKSDYLGHLARKTGGEVVRHDLPARQGTLSGKAVSKGGTTLRFKDEAEAQKFAERFKKRAKYKKDAYGAHQVEVKH